MRKALPVSWLLLVAFGAVPASSAAVEMPKVMIMGEDADKDSVPRTSRIFKRVIDALSNQLHDNGFDVYDEAAVIGDDEARQRSRRSDAELIDIARSATRPPIDVAVIFSIYASAQELSYTTKVRTRLSGRILNVRSGQRLGNFEVSSPREWRAPIDCPRECVLEIAGKSGSILAQDLGAVLVEKLRALWSAPGAEGGEAGAGLPNAYALVFNNFSPDDMMTIEEYLVAFSGYRSHRPVYDSERRHEYWYESFANGSRLIRNLRKMLDHLDMRGRVTFSGATFTVEQITVRD